MLNEEHCPEDTAFKGIIYFTVLHKHWPSRVFAVLKCYAAYVGRLYQHFGATNRSHRQRSNSPRRLVLNCPEMLVAFTNISGQPIGPIFKGQTAQEDSS
jgi:hypothetical protein